MLKILLVPLAEKSACFWCENKKKLTISTEFSNGFLRGKPLCFDCLERAVRVQTASEAVRQEQQSQPAAAPPPAPEGKPRKEPAE